MEPQQVNAGKYFSGSAEIIKFFTGQLFPLIGSRFTLFYQPFNLFILLIK